MQERTVFPAGQLGTKLPIGVNGSVNGYSSLDWRLVQDVSQQGLVPAFSGTDNGWMDWIIRPATVCGLTLKSQAVLSAGNKNFTNKSNEMVWDLCLANFSE